MKGRFDIRLVVLLLIWLALSTAALAGPIPPAEKSLDAPSGDSTSGTRRWYLRNGAFDQGWDGDVPQYWQVYPGAADAYGALGFPGRDATGEVVDNAFVFQIINDEVQGDRNAYLYQKVTLPTGDYWINVHTAIYGTGAGSSRLGAFDTRSTYTYMAYYALIPQAETVQGGSFAPGAIHPDAWKELWPWSVVCSEETGGWASTGTPQGCDYVNRAETVTVAGGEYVFVLRAELKWPDWRASASYVFDDIQIISATPLADNWNACVTSFCLEGLIKRER